MLKKNSKIFIAGHKGMVGSAILRLLRKKGYKNIHLISRKNLDLTNQIKTDNYIKKIKPEYIIIAAAKVGGILSNNNFKAEFLYENIMIQTNLIHSAYKYKVKKLIFLGSSCIYPKFAKQPIVEKSLLTGPLEPTNDAYAIAKICGVKMIETYNKQYGLDYLCLMPTNLYGQNDNYNLLNSHFFPALINKILEAKKKKKNQIIIWGNGKAKRELMHVDDMAIACEHFLKKKTKHYLINIGSGIEKSIKEYAEFIMSQLDIKLKIKFDKKKPNGTPRKILNTKIAKQYNWKSKINLIKGFKLTISDFYKRYGKI